MPNELPEGDTRERVARAIYAADGNRHGGWFEKSEEGREYWRALADAAIKALELK